MTDTPSPHAVGLSCDHYAWYQLPLPSHGDKVWCRRCEDYRLVTAVRGGWSVRCNELGCRVHKHYGPTGETQANRVALNHSTRYKHRISVRKNETVTRTYDPESPYQPVMPWLRDHQNSLKNLGKVS